MAILLASSQRYSFYLFVKRKNSTNVEEWASLRSNLKKCHQSTRHLWKINWLRNTMRCSGPTKSLALITMKPTWASCRLRKKISLNGQLSNLTSTVKSQIAQKFWRRLLTTTLMRWSIYALTSGSSRLWFRLMTRWRNASRYSNRITSGTCPWSCRVTGCVWVWLLERTCLSTCRCED